MYRIEITKKALKQLSKIELTNRIKLYDKIETLTNWPDVQNIIKLKNHTYDHRLRVGIYRVLFNVYDTIEIISIEEVKKRNEHTY